LNREAQRLLAKSARSLAAARELNRTGFPEFAVSRAYYAMFYVAEAFLITEGLSYSSHAAVIAAFGRLFAKTGRVPVAFHRYLIDTQDQRNRGDYDLDPSLSESDAEQSIECARQMLDFGFNVLAEHH
jgi:uncharacterized protein (UPF0332 family)